MTSNLCFIDTNVLVYSRDSRFPEKQAVAVGWLRRLVERDCAVLSPQIIGEFHHAILKKRIPVDLGDAHQSMTWLYPFVRGQTDLDLIAKAWNLRRETNYQWWDCVILASAIDAGCRYLLSEDYAHGHTVRGVTILNPFRSDPDVIYAAS